MPSPLAKLGARYRALAGSPPADPDDLARWLWEEFAVFLHVAPLPDPIRGLACPYRGHGARGLIAISDEAPHPREVAAHELGHLADDVEGVQFSFAPWQATKDERRADEFAACLLIDPDALWEGCRAGLTRYELAARFGCSVALVELRWRLLLPRDA